ncbi:MAG: histidine phosphatase family protein [Actinomycetia bacterium]|nr:histidine phosphatase family protein [Actinomycetes bacterium]MCP3911664.1 histidine phosphatase family protein [Actinomycetes bacterium]MCP4086933.1 histidine phosphatase family protein [Actinomycetes bacterium]
MIVYLVRHADAGGRRPRDFDSKRPLSDRGAERARTIADELPAPTRVVSSPALRCRQTVEPLADRHGLVVEDVDELFEGSDPLDTLAWLLGQETVGPLVCSSHGDLIPELIDHVIHHGALNDGARTSFAKGSVWELTFEADTCTRARCVSSGT